MSPFTPLVFSTFYGMGSMATAAYIQVISISACCSEKQSFSNGLNSPPIFFTQVSCDLLSMEQGFIVTAY